jgi:hypothetical protein
MKARARTFRAGGRPRALGLLIAAALGAGAAATAASAQMIVGSPGAGFQNWTLGNLDNQTNGPPFAPYWNAPTKSVGGYSGNSDSKNIGFCLTGSGDCVGVGSHAAAPGPLPFWGMTYNSGGNSGGAMDPKVYFRRGFFPLRLGATLELQLSTVTKEVNEIGWFETDANGAVLGPRHRLFQGGGVPPGSATPDPVGKSVAFWPTQHFGYYFSDVSENGCLAYTLSGFTQTTTGCADHNFAVFSANPASFHAIYWIAGEDPAGCGDGDCNLTVIKVER